MTPLRDFDPAYDRRWGQRPGMSGPPQKQTKSNPLAFAADSQQQRT